MAILMFLSSVLQSTTAGSPPSSPSTHLFLHSLHPLLFIDPANTVSSEIQRLLLQHYHHYQPSEEYWDEDRAGAVSLFTNYVPIMQPSHSTLSRSFLESGGFHRHLQTTLSITIDRSQLRKLEDKGFNSAMLMREIIPAEFYLDLYQLNELYQFKSKQQQSSSPFSGSASPAIQVLSYESIELESCAERSKAYVVWLYLPQVHWTPIASQSVAAVDVPMHEQQVKHELTTSVSLPIHARYQMPRAGPGSTADASIAPPQVFLRFSKYDPTDQAGLKDWVRLQPNYQDANTAALTLKVPVGDATQCKDSNSAH